MSDMEDRIRRLEEHLGFAEHAGDQISDEVAALGRVVDTLRRRIDVLEERLARALEADEDESGSDDAGP